MKQLQKKTGYPAERDKMQLAVIPAELKLFFGKD